MVDMGFPAFKHLSEQNLALTIFSLLKVSDAKTVSSILYPDSPNPHSSVVQTQKRLNLLVETGKLIRGKGWYALPSYRGSNPLHDRLVTSAIARLILLKLPISAHREVSWPIGLRSDIVCLIGKNGKALCAILEIKNTERPEFLRQKLVAWENWKDATIHLSQLFKTTIPTYSVFTDIEQLIKEVQ